MGYPFFVGDGHYLYFRTPFFRPLDTRPPVPDQTTQPHPLFRPRASTTSLPPGSAMSHSQAESLASPPTAAAPPQPEILRGWIKTAKDALLVFEATRVGIVPRVTRRFHELEKRSIIQSGAILVFTEEESGIKRWTDPYLWSASRMQGNFLVSTPSLSANNPWIHSPCHPRCIVNARTSRHSRRALHTAVRRWLPLHQVRNRETQSSNTTYSVAGTRASASNTTG